jgi:hypothetical protein
MFMEEHVERVGEQRYRDDGEKIGCGVTGV